MKVLNHESFAEALTRCYKNGGYRVGVVFDSTVTYAPFLDELNRLCRTTSIPGVISVKYNNSRAEIRFRNGSYIELFIINGASLGRCYNEFLVEESVNYYFWKDTIEYMTIKDEYIVRDSKADTDNDSDELGNFLSGFKIVGKANQK